MPTQSSSPAGNVVETVSLIDGRMIPVADIQMENDGWNFSRVSSGERLTYKLKQSDKRYYFPDYDVTFGNDQISKDLSGAPLTPPLTTNVTVIAAGQLLTDPLAAPAETLSNVGDRINDAISSHIVWGLVIAAGVVILIYYVPRKP